MNVSLILIRRAAIGCVATLGWIGFASCHADSETEPLVQVVQTSRAGDRLAHQPALAFSLDDGSTNGALILDPQTTYQSIVGFGGAVTEISAYLLGQVPPRIRQEVLQALFSPQGAWWSLCRTHINSTTFFPTGQYTYDDVPGDFKLTHFDISHDRKFLIPLIRDALAIKGAQVKFLATPWTPPGWMKISGKMEGGSPLRPECYDAWALYFSKYIKAYARLGIRISFVTVQNESEYWPEWNGCVYTPAQQQDFVQNHLGPQFEKDRIDTKILIYDHNTDHIMNWADAIYPNQAGSSYIWGTAFHWYAGDRFDNVQAVHDKYPAKHLLFTEGCQDGGGHAFEWAPAERYARAMIGDLNHWTEGWIDWNMALDETGGPVPGNITGAGWRTSAPIMVRPGTGGVIYNPHYYVFTQFSKYIRPDARRIRVAASPSGLETTAFKNRDGSIVAIAFNPEDQPVPLKLVQGNRKADYSVPGHAIVTFLYRLGA